MAIIATKKQLAFTGNDILLLVTNLSKDTLIFQRIREKLISAEDEDEIMDEYGITREQFIDNWLG